MPRTIASRAASLLVAIVVAACTAGPASTPASSPITGASVAVLPSVTPSMPSVTAAATATPVPTVAASSSTGPTAFTSKVYGYSLTVPGGWTIIPATAAWDGKGAPFHDVPEADQFVGPAAASAWFFGAPTTKDLAGRVKESIAANAAEHGNTCPAVPQAKDSIVIGSEAGTLLAYDCGILINSAITVHKGMAYLFGFRDPAVHAATDPTDRAAFLQLLKSVRFRD